MRHLCWICGLVFLFSFPVLAQAQESADQSEEVSPRSGFWFRGNVGAGSALFSTDFRNSEVSGESGMGSFAFGKFVNDRFVVFAELGGASITGPTFEIEGQTRAMGDEISANVFQVGVGGAYYLIPQSVYAGLTLTTAQMQFDQNDTKVAETDTGFGVILTLGKDWAISEKWLLGGAGQLLLGTMDDQGGSPTWTTRSVGVSFSFTYAGEGWGQN